MLIATGALLAHLSSRGLAFAITSTRPPNRIGRTANVQVNAVGPHAFTVPSR